MIIRTTLFIAGLLLSCLHLQGQMVIDALTGEAVAYANIQVVNDPEKGTSTAEDGSFSLNVSLGTELRFSSIGYKPQNQEYTGEDMIVLLEKQIAEIEEIVIKPDESEAARVIELCVANRSKNAPMHQPYFQCQLYNKYRIDMLQDSMTERSKLIRMLEKQIQGETVFFSESAMTYKFSHPNRVEEHIIANHVAGFEEAHFNFLPEQIVTFDLHQDFLDLLNRHYLLPISKGSKRHYALHLEETKIYGTDTTWYIQFWPEKSTYDLLRGHVVIHSDGYAIEEYRLTNNRKDYQNFDIYHHFSKIDGRWFPDKMFSNIVMSDPTLKVSVLYDQKTYVSDVAFDTIEIKIADANRMDYAEGARENPDRIRQYRSEPLSTTDTVAINNMSQTVDNLKIEKRLELIANLTFGRLPIGKVDLEVARFFWWNKTEGYRAGLGLVTNDYFNKRLQLNAFAGYGLRDKKWKYGGGITYHLNEQKSASLYAEFEQEINPISSYVVTGISSGILTNFYNDRLDDVRAYQVGVKGRLSNWSYDLGFESSTSTPRYDYAYQKQNEEPINVFDISEFKLRLNYVEKKIVPFYAYEIAIEDYHSSYLDLKMAYAVEDLLDGNMSYFRTELFAMRPMNFKHWGRVVLGVHTGFIVGDKPLSRLHIANGSNSSGIPYQLSYAFNTMKPFTYFADRYVNLFYDHRLFRLYQTRYSAPYIHIAQNSGWGELQHPEYQLLGDDEVLDYRNGYHESGFILESILRYEMLSILHLGFDVGAWYRWGPYSEKNVSDDLVFKIGLNLHW